MAFRSTNQLASAQATNTQGDAIASLSSLLPILGLALNKGLQKQGSAQAPTSQVPALPTTLPDQAAMPTPQPAPATPSAPPLVPQLIQRIGESPMLQNQQVVKDLLKSAGCKKVGNRFT